MTRKLGRLLVVALVVAAVVAPMSVASADIGEHLECMGIVYDPMNPNHVMYPDMDIQIHEYYDMWEVWDERHFGGPDASDLDWYIVFDMGEHFAGAPNPAYGDAFVFFWNDLVWDDPAIENSWSVRIEGTMYNDIICGGPEDDVILGRGGDDVIQGGSFEPSAGNNDEDVIRGGSGDDILYGGWGYDGITGNPGDDMLYGGFDWDLYPGGEPPVGPYPYEAPDDGNDMFGGAGDDMIFTGTTGEDIGIGGGGDDILDAELNGCHASGGVFFRGGPGNDVLIGGCDTDFMFGNIGDDELWGMEDWDFLRGGPGSDILYASSPDTLVTDDDSDDELYGGDGDDQLIGGVGEEDALFGQAGNDVIIVGGPYVVPGVGTLDGAGCVAFSAFNRGCFGGPGADTMYASGGGGSMYGGSGDDTLLGSTGVDDLHGLAGNDLIYGSDNDDTLYGGAGYDDIFGEKGVDWIYGGSEADWIDGGAGADELFGDGAAAATTDGADVIYGGDDVDTIRGGNGADELYGDAGDDFIFSGYFAPPATEGADTFKDKMFGGAGNDTYWGGCLDVDEATETVAGGHDTFYFVPVLFGFVNEAGDSVTACV